MPIVAQIERHDSIGPTIDGRFEHHFVVWVTELRPPEKVWF